MKIRDFELDGMTLFRRSPKNYFCRHKRSQSSVIFDSNDIFNVLKDLNTKDVISKFLSLKRAKNGDLYGKCPFKHEWSDVGNRGIGVHRSMNYFKCFCCGHSGNGIRFVQLLKDIPFDEALVEINSLMFDGKKLLRIVGTKRKRHFVDHLWNHFLREIEKSKKTLYTDEDDLPF